MKLQARLSVAKIISLEYEVPIQHDLKKLKTIYRKQTWSGDLCTKPFSKISAISIDKIKASIRV